jgi:hypothetical protein
MADPAYLLFEKLTEYMTPDQVKKMLYNKIVEMYEESYEGDEMEEYPFEEFVQNQFR